MNEMASKSKEKFNSIMLVNIKVSTFSFSLVNKNKMVTSEKFCSREHPEAVMVFMFMSM